MKRSLFFFLLAVVACSDSDGNLSPEEIHSLTAAEAADRARTQESEVNVTLAPGLQLDLWASDELVHDPVALSIAPDGRVFYTSAHRGNHSEFDIRGHMDWATQSIGFQTVEDRREFLRRRFAEPTPEAEKSLQDLNNDGVLDWRDLTVEQEEIWTVADTDHDGRADRAQLYLRDYHDEITDLNLGLTYADNGDVFVGVGPDLWRTRDTDGDGIANLNESISHGYAIHIGFGSHGMSGVKQGPDGRIYWGIGDIGANVVDPTGLRWKYPNQGVIVRSEPDGSNFEVFAAGLRNVHEFDWDQHGNLIGADNDGDHEGERERLVYLIDGSDSGWRTNWQFGKYTDSLNNDYKVWMDEGMSVPRWEGQADYFLPPIQNYVNGPTGLVFNPGTALSDAYRNHFFVVEFRGGPSNSPLHSFKMAPDGAGFRLDTTQKLVEGVLPTGIAFGPDGALYFGDWMTGWDPKQDGRMWKLDVADGGNTTARREVQQILAAGFGDVEDAALVEHLAHADRRVRLGAQFELVRRRAGTTLQSVASDAAAPQLARLHAIWAVGQIMRADGMVRRPLPAVTATGPDGATNDAVLTKSGLFSEMLDDTDGSIAAAPDYLLALLRDGDPQIVVSTLRVLGERTLNSSAAEQIMKLLNAEHPHVQRQAIETLGRARADEAIPSIVNVIRRTDGKDNWLRHAAQIALARINQATAMVALQNDASEAVRSLAVVALRRMRSPEVAVFLQDESEHIVAEAARAIHDDGGIADALPALAELFDDKTVVWTSEPIVRRVISANMRLGTVAAFDRLIQFAAGGPDLPATMRAEALLAAGTWKNPSPLDRVDGRYRGTPPRGDDYQLTHRMTESFAFLLAHRMPEVRAAAAIGLGRMERRDHGMSLRSLVESDPDPTVRRTGLAALQMLASDQLRPALALALRDRAPEVRTLALEILPNSDLPKSETAELLRRVAEDGTTPEQQTALAALGRLDDDASAAVLAAWFDRLEQDQVPAALRLDVLEAARTHSARAVRTRLATYEARLDTDADALAPYREALAGGNPRRGSDVFYRHAEAQCVRCHTVFEYGGNAGPVLEGVGQRLSREELLESIVAPSARFAEGYEMVAVRVRGEEDAVAGTVLERTAEALRLDVGDGELRTISTEQIEQTTTIPSSMMPMGEVLTRMEIRDLVAWLATI